jgi:uncharacterized protein YihD (DUF1040 family)
MANWALVENNQIKEVHDLLPKNWKNISGLNLSEFDNNFLKELGWHKVQKQHQEYDNTQYEIEKYFHEFINDVVIETLILKEKIQNPVLESENSNYFFPDHLRNRRNELLLESDWTQLADVQKILTGEKKLKWSVYRQKLRDLPDEYSNNIDNFIWPEKPL